MALAGAAMLRGSGHPSAHMAEHLLLGMIAPLGLVLGAPVTLLFRVSSTPTRRTVARLLRSRVVHVLSHPITAALLSTGGLYLIMLTPIGAAAHDQPLLHSGIHAHYLLAGCLFTWSIAGPDPAPRRPGLSMRLIALLMSAAAHAYLAKHLYARADTDAMRDAAQLMYYGGDIAELLLATALFTLWYRRRLHAPASVAPLG